MELIAELNYGKVRSKVHWLEERKSAIETIELGHDLFMVRASRLYYVADVMSPSGTEGGFHSRLASIANFSDYLKEAVPSFEMNVFYINDLSGWIIPGMKQSARQRLKVINRDLRTADSRLSEIMFRKDHDIATGHEQRQLETEIKNLSMEAKVLVKEVELEETLKREYRRKGVASIFTIRTQTRPRICLKEEIEDCMVLSLEELDNYNNVIKNKMWAGFNIKIEDLTNPAIAFSSETLGVFDPRQLIELEKEYPQVSHLREGLDEMFIHKWAREAKVGERTYRQSTATAQAIANLLRKSPAAKRKRKITLKEPEYDRLTKVSSVRPNFLGFVLDGALRPSPYPYIIDMDSQALTHTSIVGGSGSGKTVTAFDIAEGALKQGIPVVVLDAAGQWNGLLKPCSNKGMMKLYEDFRMPDPYTFPGRIYTPGSDVGIDLETRILGRPKTDDSHELAIYASETSSMLREFCTLSEMEEPKIRDVIFTAWEEGRDLDHTNILDEVDVWAKREGRRVSNLKIKLGVLKGYSFLFEGRGIEDISDYWRDGEATIFALSHLREAQQMMTSYYLMREIVEHFYLQPDSERCRLVLVVEEVQRFSKPVKKFLDRAARETRKKGVALVYITQRLTDLAAIRANTATTIFMRSKWEADVKRADIETGGMESYGKLLPNLKIGVGIVSYAEVGTFPVKFRPSLTHPFTLSDREVRGLMEPHKLGREAAELLIPEEEPETIEKEPEKPKVIHIEPTLPDPERLEKAVRDWHEENGMWPRVIDMKEALGWVNNPKRATKAINVLVADGKIERIPDEKDGRAKRLRGL